MKSHGFIVSLLCRFLHVVGWELNYIVGGGGEGYKKIASQDVMKLRMIGFECLPPL